MARGPRAKNADAAVAPNGWTVKVFVRFLTRSRKGGTIWVQPFNFKQNASDISVGFRASNGYKVALEQEGGSVAVVLRLSCVDEKVGEVTNEIDGYITEGCGYGILGRAGTPDSLPVKDRKNGQQLVDYFLSAPTSNFTLFTKWIEILVNYANMPCAQEPSPGLLEKPRYTKITASLYLISSKLGEADRRNSQPGPKQSIYGVDVICTTDGAEFSNYMPCCQAMRDWVKQAQDEGVFSSDNRIGYQISASRIVHKFSVLNLLIVPSLAMPKESIVPWVLRCFDKFKAAPSHDRQDTHSSTQAQDNSSTQAQDNSTTQAQDNSSTQAQDKGDDKMRIAFLTG